MSDRDLMDRIFEILVEGFTDSDITVSRIGHSVFLSDGEADWSLNLFAAVSNPKKD